MKIISFSFVLIFIFITFLDSTIINIPADQPTIQQGIEVAVNSDTILVQPSTYYENINFIGKNITVASLFLTTQDTTYISDTIIDGSQPLNPDCASVVTFENGENTNAILTGFTIINGSGTYADPEGNGYYHYIGGGIYCINSNPNLANLKINNNIVESSGAGIYFYNSDANINNAIISNNTGDGNGGGICCIGSSNLNISNTKIQNNYGGHLGGGLLLHSESHSNFINVIISGNTSESSGGGICSFSSDTILENCNISNNSSESYGGGIYSYNSMISLSGTTISFNSSESKGGGIRGSNIIFDSENRSNIYSNSAQFGNDLYNSSGNTVNVIVDTFTVMNPTNYHAFPINRFTFDILHGLEPQINADLYVSPDGDNANSGLSFNDPLQTINYALTIISANSENPRTIYLNTGTYSPETNGESFPILCTSWVSVLGMDENSTIIDADMQESVIYCSGVEGVSIEDVTLTNGVGNWEGGGIYCTNSELNLSQITISNCHAGTAGGIYHTNSNSVFNNITVINNEAKHYGGIFSNGYTLSIIDSDIISNHADETAGGICCQGNEINITSTNIIGNIAGCDGGGMVCSNSDSELTNVLISENTAYMGGGISCWNSNPILENVTISYNIAEYQGGGICCYEDFGPVFSEENRCNIYLNTSPMGNDLYSQEMMNVIVDTFTVMTPTGFHASPITNFTFDIQHGMIEQVNADLYVSPLGDDANDGLSWDSPLKTVNFALSRILVDSLNQHTIFLSDGVFSPETNGEIFPIRFIDYITLSGMGIDSTFINVAYNNENSDAFVFESIQTATLENMTIANSYGIECSNNSSPKLLNLSISDNIGYGIRCVNNSDPFIKECIISNNSTGIMCSHESDPIVINTTISNNSQQYSDGGIYCYDNSHPILVNSILWDNDPQEIELTNYGDPCSVTISHCDIQGGENGIIVGNGSVNWLNGNINENPHFVEQGNFNLLADSPCIDAGIAFFEWQGNTLLDMTPDEYFGIAPDIGGCEWDGTSIDDQQLIPLVNKLHGNYPNPFNPSTTISFSVIQTSSFVTIDIYNIKGQKVKTLPINHLSNSPVYQVTWNGTDQNNQPVASGIYFYQLNVDDEVIASKKCLLLK
ncbi:MAG: right-handed parallel beta-helix repeat-containing protein [Candidatus Cloacimonetes bacterium]|nr:right-handed parallel beta-helix repeat-containing protein [Candidatus Cloacimonadota bacterium]